MNTQSQAQPQTTEPQTEAATEPQTETTEIAAGYYKGRGILGSEQVGITDNGNDQIGIDLLLVDLNRTVTTVLIFTDKSEKYSLDRLRALGWTGGDTMAGIDQNEVQVQIKYDVFQDPTTQQPKRTMKAEIVTGGGRFVFKKPMDDEQKRGFFSRLKDLAANGSSQAAQAAGAPGGYPTNWDEKPAAAAAPTAGPAAGRPPRVSL